MKLVQNSHQWKPTAHFSSDSVKPRFHLIYSLFDTNAPITKIVYTFLLQLGTRKGTQLHQILG